MTNDTIINDPIAITVSMDENGRITPTRLTWRSRQYTLVGVGRQWESNEGRHILVEAAGGERFEIRLLRKDLRWYLHRVWQEDVVA